MARDLALEDSYMNEPTGELADFMDSIRGQASEHGFDVDELLERIGESAYDGGINAKELDDIMRNTEWYAEDFDTGDLINNEVYRKAIEDSGYDSITHKGNIFSGMDIDDSTRHYIMLNKNNIRSANAKFLKENIGKPKLMGNATPEMLGLMGLGSAGAIAYDKNK